MRLEWVCPEVKKRNPFTKEICVQEFDSAVVMRDANDPEGQAVPGNHSYAKKYKDFIWQKIAQSDDPPLRVIRGKITGPKGYIKDLVARYVKKNYQIEVSFEEDESEESGGNKKKRLHVRASLDKPLRNDDSEENGSFLEAQEAEDSFDLYFSPEKKREECLALLEPLAITWKEAALLLATSCKISLADPMVLDFCQLKKSAAYNLFQKVISRFQDERISKFQEYLRIRSRNETVMLELLFEKVKMEKGDHPFLTGIEKVLY